jgi:hypothetical protein
VSKLIAPARVEIADYYQKFLPKLKYVGAVELPPEPKAPPSYQTWDLPVWNAFYATAPKAKIDGVEVRVMPVFINDEPCDFIFDTECTWTGNLQEYNVKARQINTERPFIVFFKGNDDWSHGLRFTTAEERDTMISTFGAELGTLPELLGWN